MIIGQHPIKIDYLETQASGIYAMEFKTEIDMSKTWDYKGPDSRVLKFTALPFNK